MTRAVPPLEFPPLKLYEYASCGRPIIATDLAGLKDFIDESKSGLLIQTENSDALCDATRQLWLDTDLRNALGVAGAEYVRNGFSWQERAVQTIDVLRQVTAERENRQ